MEPTAYLMVVLQTRINGNPSRKRFSNFSALIRVVRKAISLLFCNLENSSITSALRTQAWNRLSHEQEGHLVDRLCHQINGSFISCLVMRMKCARHSLLCHHCYCVDIFNICTFNLLISTFLTPYWPPLPPYSSLLISPNSTFIVCLTHQHLKKAPHFPH